MNKLVNIATIIATLPITLLFMLYAIIKLNRLAKKMSKNGQHKISIGKDTIRIQGDENPNEEKPFTKTMDVLLKSGKIGGKITVKATTPEELDAGVKEVEGVLNSLGFSLADHV